MDEISFETKNKCLDFTRIDGRILLEADDGYDRVEFWLDAEAIEKLKTFLGGEEHRLESADAVDTFPLPDKITAVSK